MHCPRPVPIALLINSFESGGTERQMVELVRRLDPARWRLHLACFHARGPLFARASEPAASVAAFPLTSFKSPSAARAGLAFAAWCRTHRIAILHTADFYANVFGLPMAALARVPVRIANRREVTADKTSAQLLTQRLAYAFAQKVVANSGAAADQLRREQVPSGKIVVVHNGLEVARFHPGPRRGALRRIVVVANLRREKGHDVLLDAASIVLRDVPDARFAVVGGGPEFARLRAQAEALGVAHAVQFLGHREDVAAQLAGSDIFVLPSRSEALPNALLEAMSAALPIVASAVGGIVEVVDHGRTGLLVPPDDARVLAASLRELMSDPARAGRLGSAARAAVASRFSFDRMAAAFDGLYSAELDRRGGAARQAARWAAC